jgi:hypothetical protein
MQPFQHLYSHLRNTDVQLYWALDTINLNEKEISDKVDTLSNLMVMWRVAPKTWNSSGVVGQIAFDDVGNLYWCYKNNNWARIGPLGYSNSF